MLAAYPILWLLLVIFLIILGALWFLLPFAIFGMKPLIRELIDVTRENNRMLAGGPLGRVAAK